MARTISTFLMFEGAASEAIDLYVSLFRDSRVVRLERYAEGEPGRAGTVKRSHLVLAGHDVMCFDSPSPHAFGFTPAISLFVECESAEELDGAFARLLEGGQALMPLGDYGFSARFGWVTDRFGVSWQLNLA
ncbi:MAG: VOC family protein [Gemmatirosa sp.]